MKYIKRKSPCDATHRLKLLGWETLAANDFIKDKGNFYIYKHIKFIPSKDTECPLLKLEPK